MPERCWKGSLHWMWGLNSESIAGVQRKFRVHSMANMDYIKPGSWQVTWLYKRPRSPFSAHCPQSARLSHMHQLHLFVLRGILRNINDVLCDGFITQDLGFILTSNFTNTAMRKLKSARFLGISFSLRALFVIPITTVEGGGGAPDPNNIKTVLKWRGRHTLDE